jgi:hypothetical protein
MGSSEHEADSYFQFDLLFHNPLSQNEWENLRKPIMWEEIENIITSWPNNKSSGPDGFIGEFFKHLKTFCYLIYSKC